MSTALNETVADRLREMADLLRQQEANPFRAGAYRRAADTVAALDRDLSEILQEQGVAGLTELPGVGRGIANAIDLIVRTGRWPQLERVRGSLDPERVFQSIPGVGPELARRIHDHLGVDTLEALEVAAHDGRLETVPGVGPRRAAMVRSALEGMLRRVRARGSEPPPAEPTIAQLLDVDREYRDKAAAGRLRTIAPRRFNPSGEAWLPILHTQRGPWDLTALFSNTALAHELGRTRDWLVVYFHSDHRAEGQRTIVTETRGPLAGRRVVRGREAECREHYGGEDSTAVAG